MKTQFPLPPINTKIVGTSPAGETSTLIELSKVEEHVQDGTYRAFVRVLIYNSNQSAVDSFFFDVDEDYKLCGNFLQTNEDTMELLTFYMMAIQDRYDLNKFTVEVAKKFQSDFWFTDVRMIENKKGAL